MEEQVILQLGGSPIRVFARKISWVLKLRVQYERGNMSATNLVSYESATSRKWTVSWAKGYFSALTAEMVKIDRLQFDAMLTGKTVDAALNTQRAELARKQEVVALFIQTRGVR